MQVRLLKDLTNYNPRFSRNAIGESNMCTFQLEGKPWRVYVNVSIGGETIPVGTDCVECLDPDYIQWVELGNKIMQKEQLRELREAQKVYHAVSASGANKGIYLKREGERPEAYSYDNQKCKELLELCDRNGIAWEEVRREDIYKL